MRDCRGVQGVSLTTDLVHPPVETGAGIPQDFDIRGAVRAGRKSKRGRWYPDLNELYTRDDKHNEEVRDESLGAGRNLKVYIPVIASCRCLLHALSDRAVADAGLCVGVATRLRPEH